MKFTCYGCRGSYPITRADSMKYGGNTSCYFIEEGNTKIILDGGTGIAYLGRALFGLYYPDPLKINIFLSHGHWDHIMGLPLFHPFYFENNSFTIHAPGSKESDVSRMVIKLHQISNSSIPFEKLQANIKFKNLKSGDSFNMENLHIETYQINHPSIDLGYRISSKITKRSITILTDIAPITNNYLAWGWKDLARGNEKKFENDYYEGLVNFCHNSDIIISDTHFTDEDIKDKEHWGHSTPSIALDIAKDSKSNLIMMTHHNPEYTDEKLDYVYSETVKKGRDMRLGVMIAKERGKLEL